MVLLIFPYNRLAIFLSQATSSSQMHTNGIWNSKNPKALISSQSLLDSQMYILMFYHDFLMVEAFIHAPDTSILINRIRLSVM
jgi:uncharacterized membrane protein YpjA